jgi:hypothetical protein
MPAVPGLDGNRVVLALAGAVVLLGFGSPARVAAAGSESSGPVPVGQGTYLTDARDLAGEHAPRQARRSAAANERQPLIVGGNSTSIQAAPWQTSITLSPSYGGSALDRHICGGSLIAPTIVITAAHCFYIDGYGFDPPYYYSTVTGRTRLSSSEGQEIPVETYYAFTDDAGRPLYDHDTSRWDVVVVELASPSSATPIKLAGPDETALWTPGSLANVTGWGTTAEKGPISDTLRSARVEILPDSACTRPYDEMFSAGLMLCAGVLSGGVDTCEGDSGGPLTVPIAGGGARLVGDTSFGEGCARAGYPGVYGRLAADPIRSTLQRAVQDLAGVDIVGSGALPPPASGPPPPAAPPPVPAANGVTRTEALERAWKLARQQCFRFDTCRRYWAGKCVRFRGGSACWIRTYDKRRRGRKFSCERRTLWNEGARQLRHRYLTKWRCRRGW